MCQILLEVLNWRGPEVRNAEPQICPAGSAAQRWTQNASTSSVPAAPIQHFKLSRRQANKKKFEPLMALCCVLFALCCVGVYRGVRRRSYMSYAGSVLERAFSLTWRRCRLRLSSLAKHTPQWLHLQSNRFWAAALISENACVQAAFLSSVLAHNSANLRLMATVAPFFESTQPS